MRVKASIEMVLDSHSNPTFYSYSCSEISSGYIAEQNPTWIPTIYAEEEDSGFLDSYESELTTDIDIASRLKTEFLNELNQQLNNQFKATALSQEKFAIMAVQAKSKITDKHLFDPLISVNHAKSPTFIHEMGCKNLKSQELSTAAQVRENFASDMIVRSR